MTWKKNKHKQNAPIRHLVIFCAQKYNQLYTDLCELPSMHSPGQIFIRTIAGNKFVRQDYFDFRGAYPDIAIYGVVFGPGVNGFGTDLHTCSVYW